MTTSPRFSHAVMFVLNDKNDCEEFSTRLSGLKESVPSLLDVEVGIDELKSPRAVDVLLITRFENQAGYDAYRVDPTHVAFLEWAKPRISNATVVDWSHA